MSLPSRRRVARRRRAFAEPLERRRLLSAGSLDIAFGSGGAAYAELFPNGNASAAAMQSDGMVIVAGRASPSVNSDESKFTMVRLRASGSVDRTFGVRGRVLAGAGQIDSVNAIAMQPDKKIVVVGTFLSPVTETTPVVARYRPTGKLDRSFGAAGMVVVPEFAGYFPSVCAIDGAGRILLGGEVLTGVAEQELAIVCLTATGQVDTSFGAKGIVTNSGAGGADGLAIQRDGRILAAGGDAVVRYNPNGTLDQTFGTGGIQVTNVVATGGTNTALTLQPDGKILLPSYNGFIARLTSNGAFDPTFGKNGVASVPQAGNTKFDQAIIQPNGAVVGVGFVADAGGNFQLLLARFTSAGKLDATFGTAGRGILPGAPIVDLPTGAFEFNRRLVVALTFDVMAFNSDGTLDNSFGYYGDVTSPFGISGTINAMAVEPDGKIVVAGSELAPVPGDPTEGAVARYNTDGTLDTTFATNGIELVQIGNNAAFTSIKIARNSDIILGGYGQSGSTDVFAIVRLYYNGYRNRSFGMNGIDLTSFGAATGQRCTSLALQANGDILAGGSTFDPKYNAQQMAIARYLPSGALDPTFGVAGQATFKPGGKSSGANSVILQPDGRIVLAGSIGTNFGLVRLRHNGSLDGMFGVGGVVTTVVSNPYAGVLSSQITAAVLDDSGDIIVSGPAGVPGSTLFVGELAYTHAFARYLPNGTLDGTFGSGGIAQGFPLVSIISIALAGNGSIIAGGVDEVGASAVMRLTRSGALDATFSGGEVELSPFVQPAPGPQPPPPPYSAVTATAIQPDGKILAAAGSDLFRLLSK